MPLTLKELLRLHDNQTGLSLQERCEDLLGEALSSVLFSPGDTPATLSKIRSGYPEMGGRFKNAAQYLLLSEHMTESAVRIKSWWSNHPVSDSNAVQALLSDDDDYRCFASKNNSVLCTWIEASLPLLQSAWQAELLTVLTLLAVTRTSWETVAEKISLSPLSPSSDSSISDEVKSKRRSGLAFYRQKRYEEAASYLEKAFLPDHGQEETRIWNGDLHFWLGEVYLESWRRKQERDTLSRAFNELETSSLLGCAEAKLEIARLCLQDNSVPALEIKPAWDRHHGVTLCRELASSSASDPIRGEAFWLLYQCSIGAWDSLSAEETGDAALYLESAFRCGYPPEALRLYRENFPAELVYPIPRSYRTDAGVCVLNSVNRLTDLLKRSAPEAWQLLSIEEADAEELLSDVPHKYMLLSDDPGKNQADLLRILQNQMDGRCTGKTEIFLRGNEDQFAPIVDTAMHHMGERWIPVHILDDDKYSAQRLLGRHPLLYPLIRFTSGAKTLHFLVVGDGRCCQWLAREALWMLTLRDETVKTRITLVGPHAQDDLETLYFQCPGLRRERLSKTDFVRTELNACNCTVSYFDLTKILAEAIKSGEALYLAVDVGTDHENLDMAIRLREESIRAGNWSESRKPELPVIAFRCREPSLAGLSRSSVVVNEAGGLGWYNNYNLIPFGMDTRYTWDSLTADPLERLAWLCHLAYSGFRPEDIKRPEKQAELAAVRQDYITRTYNRDSSMAAALSLPYLLLQSRWPGVGKLRPAAWNIQDGDAFFSEESRLAFANKLNGAPRSAEALEPWGETRLLAEWEHARWCAYMISRGWVSATPEEAEAYCRAGNPRQQLYIGRMHPCITPFSKLEALEKHLRATVGLDKNFRKSSLMTVEYVEEILRMEGRE